MIRKLVLPRFLSRIGSISGLEHLPRQGPFIIASNHISYLEPVLLSCLVILHTNQRVYSLTYERYWKIFQRLRLAEWLGMVRVEREHRDRCIDLCLGKLQAGYPVLIFPEGKRHFDGALGQGKTGVARLALRSGVPVLPVAYHGRPAKGTVDTLRSYFNNAKETKIILGAPIRFQRLQEQEIKADVLEATTRKVMQSIASLLGTHYPF